jgi:hypothetical protein
MNGSSPLNAKPPANQKYIDINIYIYSYFSGIIKSDNWPEREFSGARHPPARDAALSSDNPESRWQASAPVDRGDWGDSGDER